MQAFDPAFTANARLFEAAKGDIEVALEAIDADGPSAQLAPYGISTLRVVGKDAAV